jgi:hypothetical protein
VDHIDVAAGGSRTANIAGSASAPGLGAYTIDIQYDPAVVQAISCVPGAGGLCNPTFLPGQARFTGASLGGLNGDFFSFGKLKLQAVGPVDSETALVVIVQSFADSEGHNISTGEVHDGSATIVAPTIGDVDCDGDADAADALAILSSVAGLSTPACLGVGDVNCDGVTDASDALDIMRFVAALPILDAAAGCPPIGTQT